MQFDRLTIDERSQTTAEMHAECMAFRASKETGLFLKCTQAQSQGAATSITREAGPVSPPASAPDLGWEWLEGVRCG